MSGEGIFEIREYLGSDGKVEKHDVRDISKQLDYFAKLCVEEEGLGESEFNEDEQFIRELAQISQEKDEAEEARAMEAISENFQKDNTLNTEKVARISKKSGWGKGFLEKRPASKKKQFDTNLLSNHTQLSETSPALIDPSDMLIKLSSDKEARDVDFLTAGQPSSSSSSHAAFTGNIMERAPPTACNSGTSSTIKKEGASTGVMLGPKKRG